MNARRFPLNDATSTSSGESIIYIMSRDQRVYDNHALLMAQAEALEHKLPLVVIFILYEKSRHRQFEHFSFMLDGLERVSKDLAALGIRFALLHGPPQQTITNTIHELKARSVYFDFNPQRSPRRLQEAVAKSINIPTYVVDAHNIIPAWIASEKEEFAAHTFRPKVHRQLATWLQEPSKPRGMKIVVSKVNGSMSFEQARAFIDKLPKNGTHISIRSGESAAQSALEDFIKNRLSHYAKDRNNPTIAAQSGLSPYLHFGQISALRVALRLLDETRQAPLLLREAKMASPGDKPSLSDNIDALLEELIVRKELADNYCYYNPHYDSIKGARDWARQTITTHANDSRDALYSQQDWEAARTHDEAWNAAQKQMMQTGKMHGYMRMYWAKKILEWSKSPEEALNIAVYLNDKYSIDGGDPNGYTGIMWSIMGVHDRAWFERPVYGKIRYMNANGLKKRFAVDEYISRWC